MPKLSLTNDLFIFAGKRFFEIDGKYYALNQDVNLDEWLKISNLEDAVEYNLYMIGENILAADDNCEELKPDTVLALIEKNPKKRCFWQSINFSRVIKYLCPI